MKDHGNAESVVSTSRAFARAFNAPALHLRTTSFLSSDTRYPPLHSDDAVRW